MKNRVLVGQGVIAGVVAEGAFAAALSRLHIALEDELGVGGTSRSTVLHLTISTGAWRRKPAKRISSISSGKGAVAA